MVADLNNIVRLKKSQIKSAAEMLARAYQDDPLFAYFIPDASERKNKSHYLHEFSIRYGLSYGEVYATSPNLEGVAVWLPLEKAHVTLLRSIRSGGLSILFKLGVKPVFRLRSAGDFIFAVQTHCVHFPHWYLFCLGVEPQFQGKGYASILLKVMFARLDKEHLPCYVETQSEKNVPIYQHYGFEVVEEVVIPGTGISHWAMLREKTS